MLELESLQRLIGSDPIVATTLLAAAFLAITALAAGAVRFDFAVLRFPTVVLQLAAAVALGFALALGNDALRAALVPDPDASWWLGGVRRLPLYLIALAYGPSVGLVTALLFGAFEAGAAGRAALTDPRVAILALELMVIGWLAIYPSPRQSRWSGPLHALVGYALAWGSAGLALLRIESGGVSWAGLVAQHGGTIGGVVVAALLLATVSPAVYRARFPHSRIAPAGEPAPRSGAPAARSADMSVTAATAAPPPTAPAPPVAVAATTAPRAAAAESAERASPASPRERSRTPSAAAGDAGAEPVGALPLDARERRSPSTLLTQIDLPALDLPPVRDRADARKRRLDPPPEPE